MKRTIILSLLLAIVGMMATGCDSCQSENKKQESVTFTKPAQLVVEHCVGADREYMFKNYGDSFTWFETHVVLINWMDESCDGAIDYVQSVYQVINACTKDGHCPSNEAYDTKVVFAFHDLCGVDKYDVKEGFWVEDFDLSEEPIKVSWKEAYGRMMASNFKKPHSRQCVLRKEVGPVNCNPQYIFGNKIAQIFVDAVTGEVSDKNPAYEAACGLNDSET